MGRDEVLFTSEAWKRAFDINDLIYTELCHEFYATFEFDEVVVDDELMTKKAIKFRLCGKAYAMSILDFAKHLGLYTSAKIQDYGFETYFIGGLRNDDDFSIDQTTSYDKVEKNELWLLSMFEANHQNRYANVTWLIAKWMKKKGVGTQRESLICCGQFMMRIAKRLGILSDEVLNMLSASTYYRTLDANIPRELISSNGRLIPEDIAPSILRVATPRAPYPTTSYLYDKISQLETRLGEIERMTRRQSYHSDRYARVLEHIASHYGLTLRDPYNPPNYFKQQQQQDDQNEVQEQIRRNFLDGYGVLVVRISSELGSGLESGLRFGAGLGMARCMSTRSTSNNLVSPLSNPESIIRNRLRNLGDPSLLLDFEEINMNPNNVQGPPPAGLNIPTPYLRPMEELLQAPTDGVRDAIVVPLVLAVTPRQGGNTGRNILDIITTQWNSFF
ncbi:hypothetical protein Tco_1405433 [Tanacetum coccineum]